jgi:hypothetical protein
MTMPRLITSLGLLVGALGIGLLWLAGVPFPFYPPPGIVILVAGVLFVGLAAWRWAPGVGAFLGIFVVVGFLLSPTGLPNLSGQAGPSIQIGQGVQIVGVLTALFAGAVALRGSIVSRRHGRST